MNTSCLESCCATLELASQRPTDQCLVRMVRIQQIAQSIALTMALDSGQPALQLPLMKVVQSFQAQLDAFMAELPPDLKEMRTLEPLREPPFCSLPSSSFSPFFLFSPSPFPLQRL